MAEGKAKKPNAARPRVPRARAKPAKSRADGAGEPERVQAELQDHDAGDDPERAAEREPDRDGREDKEDSDAEPDVAELEDVGQIDDSALERVAKRAKKDDERGLTRRDPLQTYLSELRRYPLLSREKEHELAVRYFKDGDLDAARQMVTANLRLVVKIAHEYRRAYRNILDLVQEGNVGLMQAVKKYDPYRGVKLSSYAAWWIRAYILKFILANWRLVKIGTTQAQRKLFFNLRKETEKLERLGFSPEKKLLAERLDVTESEVAEMQARLSGGDVSLDAPIGPDDDGRTRMDTVPSAGAGRPDVQAEANEFGALLRAKLAEFGARLEGRDHTLFTERWLTDTPKTLQEIGDKFGVSRERARQLERRILDKLRDYLEQELGSAVDIGAMATEE